MYTTIELLSIGLFIGTFGTLIGAGGGFILVPFLLLTDRSLTPEIVTAISIAIVAANALSGSIAYARSGRIDYRAGLLFALFTLPGSILGVLLTAYIPKNAFRIFFGLLLLLLSAVLLIKKKEKPAKELSILPKGWKHHTITDKAGITFSYSYNQRRGILISILVGFLSPLLGIGGGIIHVPALIQWLSFPVYVATATSHFILSIMSVVSVIVHVIQGNYDDPAVLRMVIYLGVGAIVGAQLGAYISHKIKTNIIVRILAVCLGLVGLRLMIGNFL
ncbi:sulfite exporter TauE/SafE family protein [Panacibacter ginsenosidivorans]|uniref:Probable membrane transporter protein n=1 Tax=Panacibacter ginsenosidivorans TaxID=1813871 RepID=A0A5B8VBN3_9BACT|nr:sulfite exporter TauE/SafE family protein [Panacibacter ginsenosidivorans]QEC68341.1 sulfite exporter TauE/SafE family protein [Panacibacter ginsenosidivorans]